MPDDQKNEESAANFVETDISRRLFLKGGIAVTGAMILSSGAEASDSVKATSGVSSMKPNVKGQVLIPSDPNFKTVAHDVWNKLIPGRMPDMIVRVVDEQDVAEAVKFAKANKMKVAVRGGGHNWCNPSLRNGGMMIDLSNLTKVISIDKQNKKAVVQPIVSNRDVQKALNAEGLAFPSGHCPQVKMSGYLLGGGMSWNQGTWGPGIGSVEGYDMVTPDGELITANKDQHSDFYWAARGGGIGLFAVVTRYYLKLYDLPKHIACSSYFYPLGEAAKVGGWLESIARTLSPAMELSLWLVAAPPELAERCKADGGKVALVTASFFGNSAEEASTALKPLDACPVMDKCLQKETCKPSTFPELFDASGALFPENHRNRVEAWFSNAKLADIMNAVGGHFKKTPSPATVLMYAIYTGTNVPERLPDAAFSMSGHYYGGPWTQWTEEKDDAANTAWHKEAIALLMPFAHGHYLPESDSATYPERVKKSYSEENFKKLAELRKKLDPDGVFFDYYEALN